MANFPLRAYVDLCNQAEDLTNGSHGTHRLDVHKCIMAHVAAPQSLVFFLWPRNPYGPHNRNQQRPATPFSSSGSAIFVICIILSNVGPLVEWRSSIGSWVLARSLVMRQHHKTKASSLEYCHTAFFLTDSLANQHAQQGLYP